MTGFDLKYKTKPRTTCTGIGAFVAGLTVVVTETCEDSSDNHADANSS